MTTQELLQLNSLLGKFKTHCQQIVASSESIEEKDKLILHVSENCVKDLIQNCSGITECELVLVDSPILRNINKAPIMVSVYASELTPEDIQFVESQGLPMAALVSLQTSLIMFQTVYMSAVIDAIVEESLSPDCRLFDHYQYRKDGVSASFRRIEA